MAVDAPSMPAANCNGPAGAAASTAGSIVKPDVKTGCCKCGDAECCCIPCVIL
ncbi:hypothetical protein UVI_02009040 [Ustilaginoidea virens]|nr:hypothetical protein UVI_02009040 [Ustilaginoidea virens]